MPQHPVALALIRLSGVPVAAPSANVSGRPSPTTAAHVEADLSLRVAGIVDGGETGVGVESTVVDCTGPEEDSVTILRPGGVTREMLLTVVKNVVDDPALKDANEKPRAPGMKYTHYAPAAPVWVVQGGPQQIRRLLDEAVKDGQKVGVLATEESKDMYTGATHVAVCGRRDSPESVAQHLYGALRSFDEHPELHLIYAESFGTEGIGAAIMNRLNKAAGGRVIERG
eukprot:m.115287 g.115287  ORF g.115287 m.115287 type:complete len:227 (-) comp16047_c3_seq1:166-846(-)